ncbi:MULTISPECIES: DUF956 family protein [Loigolactobacillus]|uniref:Uncharacterized protein n=1 Tax=Loigolactobacillus backii TaxID=375175 RepID=A0A192GXP7_9LACO|nr:MULTISPECIES: DUF956 family protein [Loigolactobacillus]ANK59040.1 hypothetical protein AYR52_01420 [Loigolactobacillus backii]ANK61289.1 hypothetical protein AYR53_00060 [Loigolactobacillus backii]ANK64028.1 hypothetical protein AYR54_01405 [Loigolactobacillus backii]ANK66477.1 hypothetical protein AYR55_01420 [Loigolactobacillus backii]ANK69511.1 hypothetical protein AYR56_04655 [Loigolactobacillus backii]
MVESINTKVDLVVDATSYLGTAKYGRIMVGDKGFEFFNEHNVRDFIQVPWNELDYVLASVMFKGHWIPRFAIRTKKNGTYTFSAKNPKKLLRCIRVYVDPSHMVRSLTFLDVLKRGIVGLFSKRKKAK